MLDPLLQQLIDRLIAELPAIMTPDELIKHGVLGKRTKVRGMLRHKKIDHFDYSGNVKITRDAVIAAVVRYYKPRSAS